MSDRDRADPTVAAVQMAVDDLAVERNVERVRGRVVGLPDRVDVAVLPEYALTGFADDDRIREAALTRSAAADRLARIAAAGDVAVVAGYVERAADGRIYNATGYVPPEADGGREPMTVYRKRHLWGAEAERLSAGDDRVVVETPAGTAGMVTCYDLNFVAESAWFTDRAVDVLFAPGAWPAAHGANWRLLLRARALDGVRWIVGAGRTGTGGGRADDEEPTYAGNSLVARPDGRVARELGHGERDVVATLDRDVLAEQRALVGSVPRDVDLER